MSEALKRAAADVAGELARRAADLRRPRPREWTSEESDERVARALERMATKLYEALAKDVV